LHRSLEAEPIGTYVTAVVAQLEITDGAVRGTVAIGGHPRPIIRRRDGSTELLDDAGPPPGMPLWELAPLNSIELADGDSLVLYTDGVTDVPGPAAITDDELRELIGRAKGDAPDAVADAISAEVSARRPHHERSDDTALIVLRVDPTTVAIDFPALRSSPAVVRRWLAGELGAEHTQLDPAMLGVSELVSNTVLHTGGPGVARLRRRDGRLRIEVVDDDGAHLPVPGEPALDALSGRGLQLIDDLADAWGVDRSGDGKVVWFDLPDD
jgi:anti-sigma regulatory factor (Ser/Thr protein kinase)